MKNNVFWAVVCSIILHLAFVSLVDAALLIGNAIESQSQQSVVFFKKEVRTVEKVKSEFAAEQRLQDRKSPPSEFEKTSEENSSAKKEATPAGVQQRSSKANYTADPRIDEFRRIQGSLDERLKGVGSKLSDLIKQKEEMQAQDSGESVLAFVSGLDQVPSHLKAKELPLYLKGMRIKIAKYWSNEITRLNATGGRATVQFKIDMSGRVQEVSCREEDESSSLGRSFWAAIQNAEPFEAIPQAIASAVKSHLSI